MFSMSNSTSIVRAINRVIENFTDRCRSLNCNLLILCGSVSRGDLLVELRDDQIWTYGDIDLYLVDNRCRKKSFVGLVEEFARTSSMDGSIDGYFWHMGIKYRTPSEFMSYLNPFEAHDLIKDGRILLGLQRPLEAQYIDDNLSSASIQMALSRLYCNLHYWPSYIHFAQTEEWIEETPHIKTDIELRLLRKTTRLFSILSKYSDCVAFDQGINSIFNSNNSWYMALRGLSESLFRLAREVPRVESSLERVQGAVAILFHLMILGYWHPSIERSEEGYLDLSHLQYKLRQWRMSMSELIQRDESNREWLAEKRRRLSARRIGNLEITSLHQLHLSSFSRNSVTMGIEAGRARGTGPYGKSDLVSNHSIDDCILDCTDSIFAM